MLPAVLKRFRSSMTPRLFIIGLTLLTCYCALMRAGTMPSKRDYYVAANGKDRNTGSQAHPWGTIGHADTIVKPGTTVHVAPGTYEAPNTKTNGTASARIRFVSDVRGGAQLLSGWGVYGSYVDIVGFDISNPGGWAAITAYNQTSHVRIEGNIIHDVSTTAGCVLAGAISLNAVVNKGAPGGYHEIVGNLIRNIGPSDGSCNTDHAIYIKGGWNKIENNVIARVISWGVMIYGDGCYNTVSNNTVLNGNRGGIMISQAYDLHPDCALADHNTVSNNIVMNNGGAGIEEYSTQTGPNNVYLNNVVYNNGGGDIQLLTGTSSGTVTLTSAQAQNLFFNYQDDGTGDYGLAPGAAAVGVGTSICTAGQSNCVPTVDFQVFSRTQLDAGAYAFGSVPAAWPWY